VLSSCSQNTGSIDKSTWGGVNYEPLVDDIWRTIGIHSHHQQRCENYVQMAAMIARTLVGEGRRTWRAIFISAFHRPFNVEAVEDRRKEIADPKEKSRLKRVRNFQRARRYAPALSKFLKRVKKTRKGWSDEDHRALHNSIADPSNKQSARERKQVEEEFAKAVKKKLKAYKAEQVSGYKLTALMGGKITVSTLTKSGGFEPHVDAEMIARKIPTEMKEFIEQYGENVNLKEVPIRQKHKYLKEHEAQRMSKENPLISAGEHLKNASSIEPLSDMCKDLLTIQNQVVQSVLGSSS